MKERGAPSASSVPLRLAASRELCTWGVCGGDARAPRREGGHIKCVHLQRGVLLSQTRQSKSGTGWSTGPVRQGCAWVSSEQLMLPNVEGRAPGQQCLGSHGGVLVALWTEQRAACVQMEEATGSHHS